MTNVETPGTDLASDLIIAKVCFQSVPGVSTILVSGPYLNQFVNIITLSYGGVHEISLHIMHRKCLTLDVTFNMHETTRQHRLHVSGKS